MQKIVLIFTIVTLSLAIDAVDDFDVESYLGDWFEVASSPWVYTTQEKNGFCTRARYGTLPSGDISVYNIQRYGAGDGPIRFIEGYARIPDLRQKGKLKVYLNKGEVVGGDYWIIELGPLINKQYQWAIVSEPEMLLMWVLSRNPQQYREEYEDYVRDRVSALGFNGVLNQYVPRFFDKCVPYDD
ncbi:unnamed protein product [Paramecium primaurelia]|uniref:Lipocalin/cytosolic fatty-acid binding domain-containing protein n=1 Tax=Paramecium primaurelia TaxID=5886 RepID=A0A8S1MF38_PARPR|nr:unnamed protein product [Paramecium primaurelia]